MVELGTSRRREASGTEDPCSILNFTASSRNSFEYFPRGMLYIMTPSPLLKTCDLVSTFIHLPQYNQIGSNKGHSVVTNPMKIECDLCPIILQRGHKHRGIYGLSLH